MPVWFLPLYKKQRKGINKTQKERLSMNTFFSLLISMFLIYYVLHITKIGRLLLMFCRIFIQFINFGYLSMRLVYKKTSYLNKKMKDKLETNSNKSSSSKVIDFNKYSNRKVK